MICMFDECETQAIKGEIFCAKHVASKNERGFRSEKMASFISKDTGEASTASCEEEPEPQPSIKPQSTIQSSGIESEEHSESVTQGIQVARESASAMHGGMPALKNESGVIVDEQGIALSLDFEEQSHSLQVAQLKSMNCIDVSIDHLRKLMKDVAKESITPETVNAAVNCARQMQNMMRLKLDIMKASKGKANEQHNTKAR